MPRVLVITNPAAARTRPRSVDAVMRTLEAAGWSTELAATTGPGDARRLAAEGVALGVDVVAVFGGDGTTMQAAASLVGTDVSLGVIPGGTGNLLAGNLRIPSSPARAARALVTATPRPFDLGRMERADGTHYFAVACGAGYDARVMAGTLSEQKRRWGMGAYVATTLRLIGEIRSTEHVITIDGVEYDANAAMVLVANCGHPALRPPGRRDPARRRAARRDRGPGQQFRPERPGGLGPPPHGAGRRGTRHLRGLRPRPGDPGREPSGPPRPARRRARRGDPVHGHRRAARDQDPGAGRRVRWRGGFE
jgi:diacylglycerol kinase family enzyme